MPLPIQLPEGSIVLSNRFGDGPFEDCRHFVPLSCLKGIEVEGIYNAPRKAWPQRFVLHASALQNGERSHTVGVRWAPTEKGAMAVLASLARTIRV